MGRYLLIAIEIEKTTEFSEPFTLAEHICEEDNPILNHIRNRPILNQCNKGHGPDCKTLHSDVNKIVMATFIDGKVTTEFHPDYLTEHDDIHLD